jgi:hypothetical protein
MWRGLGMEGHRLSAGVHELAHLPLGTFDHQMHLEHRARLAHLLGQRGHDERSDGDRRHEVTVHDVDMDHACTRVQHLPDLLAQPPEVGGEDGRHDPHPPQQLA